LCDSERNYRRSVNPGNHWEKDTTGNVRRTECFAGQCGDYNGKPIDTALVNLISLNNPMPTPEPQVTVVRLEHQPKDAESWTEFQSSLTRYCKAYGFKVVEICPEEIFENFASGGVESLDTRPGQNSPLNSDCLRDNCRRETASIPKEGATRIAGVATGPLAETLTQVETR